MSHLKNLSLVLVLFLSVGALAEVKLDYRQRQAVDRQERNMKDLEQKISSGNTLLNGSTQWLINKLDAMQNDHDKNNVPVDNERSQLLRERMANARAALGSSAVANTSEPAKEQTANATLEAAK